MICYSRCGAKQKPVTVLIKSLLLVVLSGFPLGYSWAAAETASTGNVSMETVGYLGQAHADRESIFSSMRANWEGSTWGRLFDTHAQANLMLTLNHTAYSFADLPDAYLATSAALSPVQVALGRKTESWNKLDQFWSLGIWEPRFRWDYLAPQEVGLMGTFATLDQHWFRLTAFGSPIFIPERGVPVEFKDGVFTSLSPWFLNLPSQGNLLGTPTPIRYQLVSPSVMDIVSHFGLGFLFRVGEKTGPWGSVGYTYKPINQLLIGYDGKYDLSTTTIKANLYPRVLYHELTSLEVGYGGTPVEGWISMLKEQPIRDQTLPSLRTQEIQDSLALASMLGIDLWGKGASATRVELGSLLQWGGDAPDLGPDSQPGVNTFESRYPFQNAGVVSVKTPLFGRLGRHWTVLGKMLYDFGNLGTILETEVKYSPNPKWMMTLGLEVLGSTRELQAGATMDFISRYRANDRVHGGISYVF